MRLYNGSKFSTEATMSEYQYYEFQAIDRPLTEKEMGELRKLSSRAEITATSFWNEYNFGDFKGNPLKMMERYFDAFLYYANWGTHTLMLRLPRETVALGDIEPHCKSECLGLHKTKTHIILEFNSEDDSGDWDPENDPSLSRLIPLRTELLSGDLRSLYLAWLAGVQFPAYSDDDQDDSIEPPVPSGLKSLSRAQKALASFLRLDEDTLTVAAQTSSALTPSRSGSLDVERWVERLSADEKNQLLIELVKQKRPHLAMELRARFERDSAASHHRTTPAGAVAKRRTVQQIRDEVERRREEFERRRREKATRQREAAERRAAEQRKKYLDEIAPREEQIWKEVVSLTEASRPSEYDRAVELLKDLRDLGEQRANSSRFEARFDNFCAQRAKKPAFLKRLKKARLV
jgi:hypothetical protein